MTNRPRNRHPLTPLEAAARLLALGVVLAGATGCQILNLQPGGELTTSSGVGRKALMPALGTAAYQSQDGDTADVYLSDIPRERFLEARNTFADAEGTIVHIHLFLVPEAGETPIDSTACNVTVRQLVLAGPFRGQGVSDTPVMGLYAGGGFVLPNGHIGSGGIGGSINGASQRLSRATPGFNDLLGSGAISGHFSAPQDEQLAQAMATKLEGLLRRLPPAVIDPDAAPTAIPGKKSPPAKEAKPSAPADRPAPGG